MEKSRRWFVIPHTLESGSLAFYPSSISENSVTLGSVLTSLNSQFVNILKEQQS